MLIAELLRRGATLSAYDPVAMPEASRIFANEVRVRFAASPKAALADADALLIVTEWKEFRSPDFDRLKELLKSPLIFDGRNIYDPGMLGRFGFTYYAIGRGKALPPE